MIYAILAWNVILTAFAVWAFIKARAYKNDQLAKMASLALDSTIIGKKIKAYSDALATTQDIQRAHADMLKKLRKEFDDVIADDLKTRADSERLFTEGLRGILDYGQQIPSLNKEAIRHE